MSDTLATQINVLFTAVDEIQQPVDVSEILHTAGPIRPIDYPQPSRPEPPTPRSRTWLVAVAAAVVILVLVGGVAWLARAGPDDIIDQPTTTVPTTTVAPVSGVNGVLGPGAWSVAATFVDPDVGPEVMASMVDEVRSWPGVIEVATAPDESAWRQLTGLESGCRDADVAPPCGAGVVVFATSQSMVQSAFRLESEFGMTTVTPADVPIGFVEGYLDAAVESASAVSLEFDPSSLGVEQPLSGPFRDYEPEISICSGPCDLAVEVEVDGVVARTGIAVRGRDSVEIEFGFTGYDESALLTDRFGRGGVLTVLNSVVERRRVFQFAALPLAAALVTFERADGSTVWQRPLAGMALIIDAPGSGGGGEFSSDQSAGPFLVLDAAGTEIMRIVDTPDGPLIEDHRVTAALPPATDPPEGAASGPIAEVVKVVTPDGPGGIATGWPGGNRRFIETGHAVWFSGTHPDDPRNGSNNIFRIDTISAQFERIRVDRSVWEMEPTADSLWVLLADFNQRDASLLSRIELESGTITDIIESPVEKGDIIVADGGLWVTAWDDGGNETEGIYRIDLATHRIETVSDDDGGGGWVGEINGGLWHYAEFDGLMRIDLDTKTLEHYPEAAACCQAVASLLGDAIWLSGVGMPVIRFDLETREITDELDLGQTANSGSYGGVFSDGAIWFFTGDVDTVTRIDAATVEVTDVIPVAASPRQLLVVGDSLWVAHVGEFVTRGSVTRIDTATRTITEVIELEGDREAPIQMIESNGFIWVTQEDGTITRITPNP